MTDRLAIALAQLNPTMGDIPGNLARARAARAEAAAAGADIVLFGELFITGYPPEDLVLKPALPVGCDGRGERSCPRYRRWRPRGPHRHALGRGRAPCTTRWRILKAARSRRSASRPTCPITACSTKSACSARGRMPGPMNVTGVRVGVPICEDIWGPDPVGMPRGNRRRDSAGAQRFALRLHQARRARERGGGARGRIRIAARLSESGGRPGRTRVRRRLVRAQRRPQPGRASCRAGRKPSSSRTGGARAKAGLAKRANSADGRRRTHRALSRHDAGAAATT